MSTIVQLVETYNHNTEYHFKVHENGLHAANVYVTVRPDQTDMTIEIMPDSGIPNTPHERAEYMLHHGVEINRAIIAALED